MNRQWLFAIIFAESAFFLLPSQHIEVTSLEYQQAGTIAFLLYSAAHADMQFSQQPCERRLLFRIRGPRMWPG